MHIESSPVARPRRRSLLAQIRIAADALLRWHANRRAYRELCLKDDRTLRDIGITRVDLDGMLSRPPWSDVD